MNSSVSVPTVLAIKYRKIVRFKTAWYFLCALIYCGHGSSSSSSFFTSAFRFSPQRVQKLGIKESSIRAAEVITTAATSSAESEKQQQQQNQNINMVESDVREDEEKQKKDVKKRGQRLVLSFLNFLEEQQQEEQQQEQGSTEVVRLILASQSPRRREILDMMGLRNRYIHSPSPLDEEALQEQLRSSNDSTFCCPTEYTQILAKEKAKAMADSLQISSTTQTPPMLVLGSDTIVDLNGKILEKPKNVTDAKNMLKLLSGNSHCVHTGVAIYSVLPALEKNADVSEATVTLVSSFVDTATVQFAPLTNVDIDSYVETKEPMDKAGSYGIQGIGGQFVTNINGDFFTVMGLPMHRTSCALADAVDDALSSLKR